MSQKISSGILEDIVESVPDKALQKATVAVALEKPAGTGSFAGVKQSSTSPKVETMELLRFCPEDISSIVGPSKSACENNTHLKKFSSVRNNVVTPAWRSYNVYAANKGLVGGPGKVFVKIEKKEKEGVDILVANITCDSCEMVKFVKMHLDKYQDTFVKPVRKMFYSLYITLPHKLIPLLIGRQGSAIQALRAGAVAEMDESVEPAALAACAKSYLKVDAFIPKDFDDFANHVNDSRNSDWSGWQPDSSDPLVKISINSFATSSSFSNFVDCLSGLVQIVARDLVVHDEERQIRIEGERGREIEECENAIDKY